MIKILLRSAIFFLGKFIIRNIKHKTKHTKHRNDLQNGKENTSELRIEKEQTYANGAIGHGIIYFIQ